MVVVVVVVVAVAVVLVLVAVAAAAVVVLVLVLGEGEGGGGRRSNTSEERGFENPVCPGRRHIPTHRGTAAPHEPKFHHLGDPVTAIGSTVLQSVVIIFDSGCLFEASHLPYHPKGNKQQGIRAKSRVAVAVARANSK